MAKPKTDEELAQDILEKWTWEGDLKAIGAIMLMQFIPCAILLPLIWLFFDYITYIFIGAVILAHA